jgi:collagen type VII alpha
MLDILSGPGMATIGAGEETDSGSTAGAGRPGDTGAEGATGVIVTTVGALGNGAIPAAGTTGADGGATTTGIGAATGATAGSAGVANADDGIAGVAVWCGTAVKGFTSPPVAMTDWAVEAPDGFAGSASPAEGPDAVGPLSVVSDEAAAACECTPCCAPWFRPDRPPPRKFRLGCPR